MTHDVMTDEKDSRPDERDSMREQKNNMTEKEEMTGSLTRMAWKG
jgi:hypothetical protein